MGECSECRFFDPSMSRCRRFPPIKQPDAMGVIGFPVVRANSWCGEYKSSRSLMSDR